MKVNIYYAEHNEKEFLFPAYDCLTDMYEIYGGRYTAKLQGNTIELTHKEYHHIVKTFTITIQMDRELMVLTNSINNKYRPYTRVANIAKMQLLYFVQRFNEMQK